jgi:hypothetical protein
MDTWLMFPRKEIIPTILYKYLCKGCYISCVYARLLTYKILFFLDLLKKLGLWWLHIWFGWAFYHSGPSVCSSSILISAKKQAGYTQKYATAEKVSAWPWVTLISHVSCIFLKWNLSVLLRRLLLAWGGSFSSCVTAVQCRVIAWISNNGGA